MIDLKQPLVVPGACRLFLGRTPNLYPLLFLSLGINILMLTPSLFMLQIFDRVVPSRSMESLTMLTIITVASLVLIGGLETLRSRMAATFGLTLEHQLSHQVVGSLLNQAASSARDAPAVTLRDVSVVRNFVGGPPMLALMDIPWMPVFLVVIFLLHPLMGAFALLAAVMLFGLALLTERLTRQLALDAGNYSRDSGRFVDSCLRNAETVVGLGMGKALLDRWSGMSRQVVDGQAALTTTTSVLNGTAKAARLLVQVLLYVIGAILVIEQSMTAGAMLAGSILLGRALHPIEFLIGTWKSLIEARGSYQRLQKFAGVQNQSAPEPTELPAPTGALNAERLVLHFPKQEKPVIAGVSFALSAGESLGLVGPSAAGKSTLARLLVGLWTPSSGALRLDGADITQWPRERLAPYLGYLPQRVEFFQGTVSENIARFSVGSSESVINAAQRAHAHEMILRLPQGYDTQIGENGTVLSGGQLQRIGLARALYGRPKLMVLDEPSANLDADGEIALLKTLKQLKQERITVIVVSHRPNILTDIDKLMVLTEGQVQAFGPRQEVMAKFIPPGPAANLHPIKKA